MLYVQHYQVKLVRDRQNMHKKYQVITKMDSE